MKHLIIFFMVNILAINAFSQKVARVTITTSDSTTISLQKCIDAGKELKYGSKDLDTNTGKVILWKYIANAHTMQQQILITSEIKDGKTLLTFRMPHMPGTIGSYTKELKKYIAKLKLSNMGSGEYFDGIE